MKELEERILKDGRALSPEILKVDSFLNHQLDCTLLKHIGEEFARLFKDEGITRVLTIEASGIAAAVFTGLALDVPVTFAKKSKSLNVGNDVLTSRVFSFTYQKEYTITVSRNYIKPDDTVLIVDDFLANGRACQGLIDLCDQVGARVAGIGICVEKAFQPGGQELREEGYRVESLAKIKAMDEGYIEFE